MPVPAPAPGGILSTVDPALLVRIHLTMVRIRQFEQRAIELFMAGELPGFLHSCLGQEAVPAGPRRRNTRRVWKPGWPIFRD